MVTVSLAQMDLPHITVSAQVNPSFPACRWTFGVGADRGLSTVVNADQVASVNEVPSRMRVKRLTDPPPRG
jgi:hypothetical protein